MKFEQRWQIIEPIGSGGQGKVSRVYDQTQFKIDAETLPMLIESLAALGRRDETLRKQFDDFGAAINTIIQLRNPENHYALKVLHKLETEKDEAKAEKRIRSEIKGMASVSHPNLLRVVDYDSDEKWFVAPFYPKTLASSMPQFKGDLVGSLTAIRPLIEGVAELHKKEMVHRDIKPENVFVGFDGKLILGDFGLVFFADQAHTRVSETFENVGSRDWMPGWAMGMKIEDVRGSFDVFSLGKLLWSMVSGQRVLQLWYYNRDMFNVEKLFPNAPFITFANDIFSRCIVENEEDCIENAGLLLAEVDKLLGRIDHRADLAGPSSSSKCKFCGEGFYKMRVHQNSHGVLEPFGFTKSSGTQYRIYVCDNCGNVQLFHFGFEHNHDFWKE